MTALKKERKILEEAASKLMSFALKGGAERAEVCGTFGQKNKITLEKQDFHLASSDHGYELGLRVTIGQKQGFASCNTLIGDELREVALKAVEITGFSPENPYNVIASAENIPKDAPAQVWDDQVHSLSLQTQKDWAKALADEATKDKKFRLNDGSFDVSSGLFLVINSKGTHKIEADSIVRWGLMGMGVDGENISSFDYFQQISRKASDVPEKLLGSVSKFRDAVVRTLQSGPARSYKGQVVFSPRAVLDVLLSSLSHHLSGRTVVEKTGKWTLKDLEKPVLNPGLTVRDLPWATDRTGWTLFDREGVPSRDMTLIDQGRLDRFLMDQYSAQALNHPTTGHAAGGPGSLPMVSPHCLCAEGGDKSWESLSKDICDAQKDFLLVHRFSGQTDPVTGDFSGVAKGADWWTGGDRAYTVKETMISGNLLEVLGTGLVGVSKDTHVVNSSGHAPYLVADGVSVTSA